MKSFSFKKQKKEKKIYVLRVKGSHNKYCLYKCTFSLLNLKSKNAGTSIPYFFPLKRDLKSCVSAYSYQIGFHRHCFDLYIVFYCANRT